MEPTTSNAEQFKQSFREEAREILTELESGLLELNESRDDADLVSRIFRGLHTIKGSGSMFGFERMAAFTHDLETAFDMVRNGKLEVSSELTDLTLAALDQISAMLEEEMGGEAVDASACARILDGVRKLSGIQGNAAPVKRDDAAPAVQADSAGAIRNWRIRFAPGPDLMRFGANPLLLLRELGTLGGLSIRASLAALPPLVELDPERCYVSWEMVLATGAERDTIRDVFIFVEDACELEIEPDGPSTAEPAATAQSDAEQIAAGLEEKRVRSAGRRTYDKPDNASSLRVPAAKLDQFVNLVGELVTVQARMSEISGRLEDAEVTAVAEEIERLTSALRESSMNIRMMPIRATFEKFRRLVHDLARELGKEVELSIAGAETELDKTVIEQLGDPLMHLIRNSMDHGIEPAAERATHGKPPTASIHLSARHSGASVLISVADDGAGIDAEAVRASAIEKGLIADDAELSDAQIYKLIFQAGFSTARKVTDVSGRGVGMDVVRQRVESLRGTVEVASERGGGTTVTMRLPLTLAIIDGLLVGVGDACFVLPMASTLECVELTREDIARANGKHLAAVRGELVPYIRLREHFKLGAEAPAIEQVMLVETGEGRMGIVVDRVLGNCQTVIKSLSRMYRQVQFVSGATILGNGTVALILDPERLVQDVLRAGSHASRGQPKAAASAASRNQRVHQSPSR
jgi:two-component system chemotaxis sensor kinase CheA